MTYDYKKVSSLLKENVCTVVFTKANDTERTMKCTLIEDRLPSKTKTESREDSEATPTAIAVWDLEKNGWRSFRIDSIKSLEVTNG